MAPQEKAGFFLYSIGHNIKLITLGSLVLEDYANPDLVLDRYIHPCLETPQKSEHVFEEQLEKFYVLANRRGHVKATLEGGSLAELGVSWAKTNQKVVVSDSGYRKLLKDPQDFLNTQVLKKDSVAWSKIQLWISAGRSGYIKNFKFLRKPKVWLCAGIYALDDATAFVVKKNNSAADVGLDSAALASLTGVPAGMKLDIGKGKHIHASYHQPGTCVWAALWRRLDIQYSQRYGDAPTPKAPRVIELLPDMSAGQIRDDTGDEPNVFTLTLSGADVFLGDEGFMAEEGEGSEADDEDLERDESASELNNRGAEDKEFMDEL